MKRVADYIRESGDVWEVEDGEGTHIGTIFYSEENRDFIFAASWKRIPICYQNDERLGRSAVKHSYDEPTKLTPHIVSRIIAVAILYDRSYGDDVEDHVEGLIRGWKNIYGDRLCAWEKREFAWLEVRKWLDLLVEE